MWAERREKTLFNGHVTQRKKKTNKAGAPAHDDGTVGRDVSSTRGSQHCTVQNWEHFPVPRVTLIPAVDQKYGGLVIVPVHAIHRCHHDNRATANLSLWNPTHFICEQRSKAVIEVSTLRIQKEGGVRWACACRGLRLRCVPIVPIRRFGSYTLFFYLGYGVTGDESGPLDAPIANEIASPKDHISPPMIYNVGKKIYSSTSNCSTTNVTAPLVPWSARSCRNRRLTTLFARPQLISPGVIGFG